MTDLVLGPLGYEVVARRQRPIPIPPRGRRTPTVTPGAFTPQLLRWNHEAAEMTDTTAAVHPDDLIYWHVLEMFARAHGDVRRGVFRYFEDGQRSAQRILALLKELSLPIPRPWRVLDFASGYGAVARHLARTPGLVLTACDIHVAAGDFIRTQLGVPTIPSTNDPTRFTTPECYDVVFALSFFTHMPKVTWGSWLRALHQTVTPGGILLFTTHGEASLPIVLPETPVDPDGFWFRPASEQTDLNSAEYGTTITRTEFVIAELDRQTGAPIRRYLPGAWLIYQDVWAVTGSAR